jgi:hypothetical protein
MACCSEQSLEPGAALQLLQLSELCRCPAAPLTWPLSPIRTGLTLYTTAICTGPAQDAPFMLLPQPVCWLAVLLGTLHHGLPFEFVATIPEQEPLPARDLHRCCCCCCCCCRRCQSHGLQDCCRGASGGRVAVATGTKDVAAVALAVVVGRHCQERPERWPSRHPHHPCCRYHWAYC